MNKDPVAEFTGRIKHNYDSPRCLRRVPDNTDFCSCDAPATQAGFCAEHHAEVTDQLEREIAFKRDRLAEHEAALRRLQPRVLSGLKHSYDPTPELFTMALAIAAGASAGRNEATCYIQEQGGAEIPCLIVEWFDVALWHSQRNAVAFPIGEMLDFLGLPLPRR